MPKFMLILLLFLLVFPLACDAGDVPYSAMVMAVRGKVEVQRERKRIPVDLGCLLYAGDRVETAQGASVTVNYLETGQEEQWPGKMRFTVEKRGSSPSPSSAPRKNRKIVLSRLESPQAGAFRLRGAETGQRVQVNGLSNTCVLEERPVFRWNRVDGADGYQVTLSLHDGKRPLWKKTLVATELHYPAAEAPLNPDTRYEWDLEATRNGRTVAVRRSCFCLTKREEIAAVKNRLLLYRRQLERNPRDSAGRLDLILFLENHHLYHDALEQYVVLKRIHGQGESLKQREESLIRLMESDCVFGVH